MKFGTQYNGVDIYSEFTPDEIGKIVPFFIRAIFNRKIVTIKIYSLLELMVTECQKKYHWNNFITNKYYLKDEKICLLIEQMPFFIKEGLKNRFIDEYLIINYEMSNIFFAIMEIFFNRLKKKDIVNIFIRFNDNNQANLFGFFELIEKNKPQLLTPEIIDYLRIKNNEWKLTHNQTTEI